YPNPQDALPLPPRPDLDQYRTRAKELVAACRDGDPAMQRWVTRWIADLVRLQPDGSRLSPADVERRGQQLMHFVRERLRPNDATIAHAQFVIARAHGFDSWPKLGQYVEALRSSASSVATFEQAADAIVAGDLATLDQLLRVEPSLVRARSNREHRSTLLHYASANGVESYRQRTPPNIIAITTRLLDAGAAIDAEADVYGGGATTLALVVTSSHPRAAGVQNALADLLLARGARLDAGIVRYCLMNGCPEAAAHLAERGARVTATDAAGIGRLDLLRQAFEPPTSVSAADRGEMMAMAAWYGRGDVIALLLELGVDPAVRRPEGGQTALHVAAYQGDAELVELLIAHAAPLDLPDAHFGTPPLVWALHAWLKESRPDAEPYRQIVRALVAAGAKVRAEWIEDDRLRAETELMVLLREAVR
ncbi:MAG: ankyrin repeat domain-containing protein, partial [Gemmatimonadales bacterium]|nr:ankyrin repeat domain-containing protein [Gemmatimonadales bacterium]